MKRRIFCCFVVSIICFLFIRYCKEVAWYHVFLINAVKASSTGAWESQPVELNITTSFFHKKEEFEEFQNYLQNWQIKTGHQVNHFWLESDEMLKECIDCEFQTGAEPDVLFYVTGAEADSIILSSKVVSVEEIQMEYPEFARGFHSGSFVCKENEKKYAVSVSESMRVIYVNSRVLENVGVAISGETILWDELLTKCEKIKRAGYIPVAAVVGDQGSLEQYTGCGCEFFKDKTMSGEIQALASLHRNGYLPENSLNITEDQALQLLMEDQAAFFINYSWNMEQLVKKHRDNSVVFQEFYGENPKKITMMLLPEGKNRGVEWNHTGYYITKKAWNHPEKRKVAIELVGDMISEGIVPGFPD